MILIFIIIIDLLTLIINIYYFLGIQSNNNFKKIDSFFFKLSSKSFYQISIYLNFKYQIKYRLNNSLEKFTKKKISLFFINFVNCPPHLFLFNKTIELLKNKYYVNII